MKNDSLSPATEQSELTSTLPSRLDSAIEETSSGIGMMIADIVKRSLIGGVSDIQSNLNSYVTDRVEQAVDSQMPAFAEAAHRVAESTSNRLVKASVAESENRTREQLQLAVTEAEDRARQQLQTAVSEVTDKARQHVESVVTEAEHRADERIQSAVSEVEDRAKQQLQSAVSGLEDSVRQTHETIEQTSRTFEETQQVTQQRFDQTNENLSQLQEKAQQSWQKLVSRFESIDQDFRQLKTSLADVGGQVSQQTQKFAEDHTAVLSRLNGLDDSLNSLGVSQKRDSKTAASGIAELTETCRRLQQQNEQLASRIAELERPRGLKAVWQKIRPGKSGQTSTESAQDEVDIDEAE